MNRYRPTVATVDLDAIRHNVRALIPPGAGLMAVVKARGYGHGDVAAARAALDAGAAWLGVAMVEEGVSLREAGIDAPVLVLSELPPGSEADALAAGLTPTVYTEDGVARLSRAAKGRRVATHVKVDTGMHRVGVWPPEEAVKLSAQLADAGLTVEGLWTHFARSEEDEDTTRGQLRRLLDAAERLDERPRLLHAANSAATILYPESHLDLVRTGLAIYGVAPTPSLADRIELRPALSWRSAVSMVRRLPAGEGISYGHRHRLDRDATIATVPVGYGDGYSRLLSSRADVLIRGRRCRIAGNVTMDQLMVDCGDGDVEAGDEVVLLGRQGDEQIDAHELAGLMDTIPYEVLTSIGPRVPREYVG